MGCKSNFCISEGKITIIVEHSIFMYQGKRFYACLTAGYAIETYEGDGFCSWQLI